MLGSLSPSIVAAPTGPRSQAYVERLARSECPALTARRARRAELTGAPHDPIVWTEARGANVRDVDDNVYVDLTSGFGAVSLGHASSRVVAAVTLQSAKLVHALGDVHPSDVKIELCERLAALAPWPDARVMLGLSGSDAIEAALKTAMLATGRPGVLAFDGSYHGLAHGPLAACGYSESFRAPFEAQLDPIAYFAHYPRTEAEVAALAWPDAPIGCVIVEPVLGRGGVVVPPPSFLPALARLCRKHGALLVLDEVLTGLHRTGPRFAAANAADADILCIGKSLANGFPVSACLGRSDVMRAWGDPQGEAIHTGTFFGQPVGCAAAIATLGAMADERVEERAASIERTLGEILAPLPADVRIAGGLAAIEPREMRAGAALRIVRRLLEQGWIALPCGTSAEAIQIAPPLTIARPLLLELGGVLARCFAEEEGARR